MMFFIGFALGTWFGFWICCKMAEVLRAAAEHKYSGGQS